VSVENEVVGESTEMGHPIYCSWETVAGFGRVCERVCMTLFCGGAYRIRVYIVLCRAVTVATAVTGALIGCIGCHKQLSAVVLCDCAVLGISTAYVLCVCAALVITTAYVHINMHAPGVCSCMITHSGPAMNAMDLFAQHP
jgi:hypothetical protein